MRTRDSLSCSDPRNALIKATALHQRCLFGLAVLFVLIGLIACFSGDIKAWAEIDWLDVAGEGLVVAAALSWLYFSLLWRPPGPVSYFLMLGFSLLSIGFYLDALDEFIHLGDAGWGGQLESVVTPLAVVVISFSILTLSQEQRVLGRQQHRREANYRDHRHIDLVTDLYNASYCRDAIRLALQQTAPFSVWMIDLQNFDAINRRYGFAAGDAILNRVAHTLVAAVPSDSLVCRYAGDCFVVLCRQAQLEKSLRPALDALLSQSVSLALCQETGAQPEIGVRLNITRPNVDDDATSLLKRASLQLQQEKQG